MSKFWDQLTNHSTISFIASSVLVLAGATSAFISPLPGIVIVIMIIAGLVLAYSAKQQSRDHDDLLTRIYQDYPCILFPSKVKRTVSSIKYLGVMKKGQ